MIETNMIDLLRVADVASQQSDRWLFIAALLLLLVFAYAVIKALVKDRSEILNELRTTRTATAARDEKIISELSRLNTDMKVSLDRNTEALRLNNLLLEKQNRRELQ